MGKKSAFTIWIFLLLIPAVLFSQAANGRITGTVLDASSAVIPGAMVEVTNTETGVVFSTLSTETGVYSAPNLPPGPYSLSVSLPGFKKFSQTGINLAAAATVTHAGRNFGLKRLIGVVSENNSGSIRVLEKCGLVFERMFSMSPNERPVRLYGRSL